MGVVLEKELISVNIDMTTPARYEMAYKFCLKKAAKWKQHAITGEKPDDCDDRVWDEFVKDVIRLAESDKKIKEEND